MVRFLLSKDDDDLFSRMENENGQVAVELAVNNRDVKFSRSSHTTEWIISCAISRKPALFEAAKGGHVAVAEVLLANGADVNVPSGHSPATDGYYFPLRAAAIHGRVGVIDALLEHVAHLHDSALSEACDSGHVETVALLFERGATLDYDRRENLMIRAAGVGSVEILEFLHRRGFDVNASDAVREDFCSW
ncbi:hypothetical protein Poli38472_001899 [Pythium oligandrum]|uniref:Ankyrin n=1 Tax=Pythium oligandrum TaxID=41045 RepID=A0A8K1CWX3_PYTOL|nr:hypothetical protein Poli38472_001899 [Pythium oligandrum]|eukprot:TMW69743.1 hypothetical protein Poli38472_001899 [Pythium oligandrum]